MFSKWGRGCGLAEPVKYDPGWDKEEYEILLGALVGMYSCLASVQLLINRYVSPGKNLNSPDLNAVDIRRFAPHLLEAGPEGLSSDIQGTLNKLQTSVKINSELPTSKTVFRNIRCRGAINFRAPSPTLHAFC